jgi:hypothetical protein
MADINPITPVATGITPPPQMSLADMMNVARQGQAYRQAEQVNPLMLQQQAQTTRTGQIALGVEEQKDIERRNMQTFFADPNNFQTEGRIDINKINAAVPKIAPLTGPDYVNKITTLSTAQTEALKAKQNLTQDQRQLVGSTLGLLGRAGVTDPNVAIKELQILVQQNPDNVDLKNLVEKSYMPVFTGMQAGPQVADSLVKASQAILTPTQQQTQLAPSMQVTEKGQTILTTPGVGTAQPTATVGIVGGMQGATPPVGGAPTAGTQVGPGMSLPYPVRRADQPYMKEPTEEKDQAAGATYRDNLVNAQMGLAQGRRNVEEVIKTATGVGENLLFPGGGIFGRLEQKTLSAMKSSEYDMLAKDLANMAITNSKAMGSVGGTVAGLDMASVANGTVKVPPEVLVKIARRVQADQTNLDMQANGAQKFALQFGDNNMKAYQQAWNANARDTRIFEAMNILENETDPKKLKTEFEKLFPTEKKRKTILKQYKNLKSLAATGVQAEPLSPEDF